MSCKEFAGAKIALLQGLSIVTLRRDNTPGLWAAGKWDFPGGGREGEETPLQCVSREALEELNIDLLHPDVEIVWEREYPALHDPTRHGYFFVARIGPLVLHDARLGNEGSEWQLMHTYRYMQDPDAILGLQTRLQDYYSEQSAQMHA
jgi:8-oxo-dGTP diphosphatase